MEQFEYKWSNKVDMSPLKDVFQIIGTIKSEMAKILVSQNELVDQLMVALFTKGHALIEGPPGVAKTLAARLMANCLDLEFSRIQFTPDLMPSDITGTSIYHVKNQDFEFRKGPIFSNIVLIDEINRSPAKTQAALFEVMEESQVTIDGTTYKVPYPFMVLATQNPIEQEGTYRLPEAQQDRFMLKIKVGYLSLEDEINVLDKFKESHHSHLEEIVNPLINSKDIDAVIASINKVYIHPDLIKYIATILAATRQHKDLYLGASTRAGLAMVHGSKALAAFEGRPFVIPEDIYSLAKPVLNHRLILSAESEMEGISIEHVIEEIISQIELPA